MLSKDDSGIYTGEIFICRMLSWGLFMMILCWRRISPANPTQSANHPLRRTNQQVVSPPRHTDGKSNAANPLPVAHSRV